MLVFTVKFCDIFALRLRECASLRFSQNIESLLSDVIIVPWARIALQKLLLVERLEFSGGRELHTVRLGHYSIHIG